MSAALIAEFVRILGRYIGAGLAVAGWSDTAVLVQDQEVIGVLIAVGTEVWYGAKKIADRKREIERHPPGL